MAEFEYNSSKCKTTQYSPFQLIYGSNPLGPIDLAPIEKVGQKTSMKAEERAAEIVKLHEKARAEIAKHNAEYV